MNKTRTALFSRPPWERMMWIHEQIQSGAHPNCVQMARELSVSLRTVKRDVEFMMDRLQLPIAYDPRRYGFYYTRPVDHFPKLAVTEAEIFAMLVADKAIAQYQGTPFQIPLQNAFQKLARHLNTEKQYWVDNLSEAVSFRPFAPDDTDVQGFRLITQALQEHRELRFKYRNLGTQNIQQRHVHPYHLTCIENHWYLFAFDVNRQGIRTFSLSRLTSPKLGTKRFQRPKDFNPAEYLRGSFSVYKGTGDFEIVVDFDAWATDLVRNRQWHESQQFEDLPGGRSRLRMRLGSLREIERWVLSWGPHASVVEPQELRDRLVQAAKDLLAKYAKE